MDGECFCTLVIVGTFAEQGVDVDVHRWRPGIEDELVFDGEPMHVTCPHNGRFVVVPTALQTLLWILSGTP